MGGENRRIEFAVQRSRGGGFVHSCGGVSWDGVYSAAAAPCFRGVSLSGGVECPGRSTALPVPVLDWGSVIGGERGVGHGLKSGWEGPTHGDILLDYINSKRCTDCLC